MHQQEAKAISEDDMASPYQKKFSGGCKAFMCAFKARADLDMDYFVGSAKAERKDLEAS